MKLSSTSKRSATRRCGAQNAKSGAGDNQFGVIAIGEKVGIYRDYPVSKGCTSPFAPIWINAMVSRQRRANTA